MLDFLFGNSDGSFDAANRNIDKNRALYDAIKDPEYSEYLPELYDNESADYKLIEDNPLLKSAQMSYLAKLSGLADEGLSDVDKAGFQDARDEAAQIARGNSQAALADAQARGVGGSGLEFAMKEIGNQGATERAQRANLETAANSARQRAQYQMAYGDALAGTRAQDLGVNQANTGIINQFNQTNTRNRNAVNQANVDSRNEAFKYNEGLKDKTFDNQMDRADRQAGFNNQASETQLMQNADRRNRERAATGAFVQMGSAMMGG